ncbi:3-hydroxybutyrate oligomer hydrolase family protein [Solilutibacter silvestris]|nr:3-hydroxybutyrate oligomer hydrolase family protein [Lysobacter silvestris]
MDTTQVNITEHRNGDDLLTAGLGLDGLRAMTPPAFADALHPTAVERRRRAIWSNWRGIADLSPNGGYGSVYGSTADVPGREFTTLLTLPGAHAPHRVVLQLPDAFDTRKRCVVVSVASGSRGVYGAMAVGAAWGLPKGCAVVHTDKAAGTDYFDIDANEGADADGARVPADVAIAFKPQLAAGASGVAFKHAHSGDNPEADWGRHVKQAAEFALRMLDQTYPAQAPFTPHNTRIIATGISNGGGAVLRAAELEGDWLDGVVAGEPNIHVEGGRALYDVATEAALLMPCALLDMPAESLPQPPLRAQVEPLWTQRCASLKSLGMIEGETVAQQAASAHAQLRAKGWSDGALHGGAASVGFDLWRAVAVAYASAYGRYRAGEHPCGFNYSAIGSDLKPRPTTPAERAGWWSDGSGIPPGNAIGLIDPKMAMPDPTLVGERCLRELWTGTGADAQRVRKGVAETQAKTPRKGFPILVIHGSDDGLVPPAFTSAPWVAAARAAGRPVGYWTVARAEHFDAFLAFPSYAQRFVPLLPYMYEGLDRVWAQIEGQAKLATDDLHIDAKPRGDAALSRSDLRLPD